MPAFYFVHSDRIVVLNHNVVSHKRVCVHKIHKTANRYASRLKLEFRKFAISWKLSQKRNHFLKRFWSKVRTNWTYEIGRRNIQRAFPSFVPNLTFKWRKKPRNLLHESSFFRGLLKLIKILLTFLLEKLRDASLYRLTCRISGLLSKTSASHVFYTHFCTKISDIAFRW